MSLLSIRSLSCDIELAWAGQAPQRVGGEVVDVGSTAHGLRRPRGQRPAQSVAVVPQLGWVIGRAIPHNEATGWPR